MCVLGGGGDGAVMLVLSMCVWGGGIKEHLQGGPKHLMVEAGFASLPHSWDGARPPRSHSQETDLQEIKFLETKKREDFP